MFDCQFSYSSFKMQYCQHSLKRFSILLKKKWGKNNKSYDYAFTSQFKHKTQYVTKISQITNLPHAVKNTSIPQPIQ